MSLATINGTTCTYARVSLPARGIPYAEVETDTPATPFSGAVVLLVDGLEFRGTVLSAGARQSRCRYRIVGGSGGWARTIPAKAFANDMGVRISQIIQFAADACGETLGDLPTTRTGPAFARAEYPAARVLDEVAPDGAWYVDELGVTQIVGAALTSAGSPAGAALTALVVDATFSTGLLATLAASSLGPSTKAAVGALLAAKSADTGGDTPGLGWPAVRGG